MLNGVIARPNREWSSTRVGGEFVRQDQDGVLAATHEIACHGEDEIGVVRRAARR